MVQILDGNIILRETKEVLKRHISDLDTKPCLTAIIVGDNPGSKKYVELKMRDSSEVGIVSRKIEMPSNVSEENLSRLIDELNGDPSVNGILLQSPLPSKKMEMKMYSRIDRNKDVDCFNPYNVGLLNLGVYDFHGDLLPCTPKGIVKLLDYYKIPIEGKRATIIGRSIRVGGPLYKLLSDRNTTVTLCHSYTPYETLKELSKESDILISAVGRRFEDSPFVVRSDMIKDGSVVVDVANNYTREGKAYGDIEFDEVSKKASYITKVPGGVGPMTRSVLIENTLLAYRKQNKI